MADINLVRVSEEISYHFRNKNGTFVPSKMNLASFYEMEQCIQKLLIVETPNSSSKKSASKKLNVNEVGDFSCNDLLSLHYIN